MRYNAKAMLSIITSVIHIEQRIVTRFQSTPELDSYSWLYNNTTPFCVVVENINRFTNACYAKFEELRNNFIIDRLNKVYNEHSYDNAVCSDFIDKLMNDDNLNVPPNPNNKDSYSFLDHNHPQEPPKVTVGEPSFQNPCSYDSVNSVLIHLLRLTSVGNDRKWTDIGCDGLPYLLASRLLDKNHNLQHILLQPGLGHFEINMTKACFRLLWDVALSELGKMLGFNSIKAQSACKSANDHHKAWQMLTIFLRHLWTN